jgi:DNA-binding MarR family transcriptional regulator
MENFDLTRFLPYQLAVVAQRVSGELSRIYSDRFDLSVPEWRVLAHLAESGEISVREIHLRVNMEKSKVSRAASRLQDRGLISKKTNPSDRRLLELSLTAAGRALMTRIIPEALRFERDLEARLGAENAANLRKAIARYLEDADAGHTL